MDIALARATRRSLPRRSRSIYAQPGNGTMSARLQRNSAWLFMVISSNSIEKHYLRRGVLLVSLSRVSPAKAAAPGIAERVKF